jgi:hypothetical protein
MMLEYMEVRANKISKLRNKLKPPQIPNLVCSRLRLLNFCFGGVLLLYTYYKLHFSPYFVTTVKGKAVPLQAWSSPEGSK